MSNEDLFSHLAGDILDQSMAKIEHCAAQLNETQLWWRPDPSMNSIGNLLLHLAGNLRQWGVVPFTLDTDKRDRASEFLPDARMPIQEILQQLRSTVAAAKEQWGHLSEDQLSRPVTIQGFDVSHMQAIMHTTSHFVGHTHQIIQLTRMQLRSDYRFHWTPDEERGDLPV